MHQACLCYTAQPHVTSSTLPLRVVFGLDCAVQIVHGSKSIGLILSDIRTQPDCEVRLTIIVLVSTPIKDSAG